MAPRVARDNDRAVRGIEAVRERRDHRRVVHKRGGHLHLVIAHHWTALKHLVRMNKRCEGDSSFVRDSHIDVVFVHLEEESRHRLERGRRTLNSSFVVAGRHRCREGSVSFCSSER